MTTCILSPYGTYDTVDGCNSSEICGMRWRCARHATADGRYELDPETGEEVLPGNPIMAHDGTYNTPEEVVCYECVVDSANETATCQATDGVQGTSSDDTCGGACNYGYDCEEGTLVWKQGGRFGPELTSCEYVCDGAGGKMLVNPGESHPETSTWSDLRCHTCDPEFINPTFTMTGEIGDVNENDVCKYTCVDGDKVFDPEGDGLSVIGCYQCLGGDVAEPVDGIGGEMGLNGFNEGHVCTYACDGEGNKVYYDGGAVHNTFECYECNGGHEYTPVVNGSGAGLDVGFPDDGGKCWYQCNDEASPHALSKSVRDGLSDPSAVARQTIGEVACWTCDGDPGPDSGCAQVTNGVGQFSSAEACDADSGAQCGWGYGCENDACAITAFSSRGRSEEECKMDSVDKCGWGYGCFNKYACVDGTACAAVPDEECTADGGADGKLVCHDSVDACIQNSQCTTAVVACDDPLKGVWHIHRSFWETDMLTGQQTGPNVITFAEQPGVDANGYTWYVSSVTFANGAPIVEIGLRDVNDGTVRTISMKFRGDYWVSEGTPQGQYWSKTSVDAGTFENPAEIVIAENFPMGECFVFDSMDLGRACGEDRCIGNIATVILQREETCGDDVWSGQFPEDVNGILSPNECPAFRCNFDPLVTNGPWAQYRGILPDGQRVYLNTPGTTFTFGVMDDEGYEWWKSAETSDGVSLSEIGIKSEIQGTERVVYAKMRGLGVWTESLPANPTYDRMWSDSTIGADDGSYDEPAATEIARLGVDVCYSPDLIQIPFALDNTSYGTISHSLLSISNDLDCYTLGGIKEYSFDNFNPAGIFTTSFENPVYEPEENRITVSETVTDPESGATLLFDIWFSNWEGNLNITFRFQHGSILNWEETTVEGGSVLVDENDPSKSQVCGVPKEIIFGDAVLRF